MSGQPQCGHRHCQQNGIQCYQHVHYRLRQKVERVKNRDHNEQDGKPRNGDFALLTTGGRRQLFNAGGQQDKKRCQHHDAQHFGNNCGIFRIRVNGVPGSHYLCHFMHGGTNVNAVGFRAKPVCQQRIHCRIQEDSDGTEDHYGGDSDGYLTGFRLHYRLGCQHGGGTTNAAPRANQPTGVAVQTKHFLPQETGNHKGTA